MVWRPGFFKTGENPKSFTALSKPSRPSGQWKVIICFFTSIMAKIDLNGGIAPTNSLWMPWPASTSWTVSCTWDQARPRPGYKHALPCWADWSLCTHLVTGVQAELAATTACLCSCALWVLLWGCCLCQQRVGGAPLHSGVRQLQPSVVLMALMDPTAASQAAAFP